MTYDFSTAGFPQVFSGIVANATMALPSLAENDDGEFLLAMNGKVMEAFWTEYVAALPREIQDELLKPIDAGDADKAFAWFDAYANFAEDEEARQLATVLLDDLREALPSLIVDEYAAYRSAAPLSA
jgi:hypothetical protein